jgi:hypothetical protein
VVKIISQFGILFSESKDGVDSPQCEEMNREAVAVRISANNAGNVSPFSMGGSPASPDRARFLHRPTTALRLLQKSPGPGRPLSGPLLRESQNARTSRGILAALGRSSHASCFGLSQFSINPAIVSFVLAAIVQTGSMFLHSSHQRLDQNGSAHLAESVGVQIGI